jgi:tetratricopeptide (TPR) repeat protein
MRQRFTRDEVVRMLGVTRRQLDYWSRLRLITPDARWGERFFTFTDLVALETLKRMVARGIPARRLRRALEALREQLGHATAPLSRLHISTNGKQIVVAQPWPGGPPIEPLTKQLLLEFDTQVLEHKVFALPSHTAEEWFEIGLANDVRTTTMPRAADAYRHAVDLAPDWVEAHVNLGTALFHLGEAAEARKCFETAIEFEPQNAPTYFNLGCVFEKLGNRRAAIDNLERAVKLAPSLAEAHLNLAMLFDASGHKDRMREHLNLYLKYEPQGRWAKYAHSRLPAEGAARPKTNKVTPFRKRG